MLCGQRQSAALVTVPLILLGNGIGAGAEVEERGALVELQRVAEGRGRTVNVAHLTPP